MACKKEGPFAVPAGKLKDSKEATSAITKSSTYWMDDPARFDEVAKRLAHNVDRYSVEQLIQVLTQDRAPRGEGGATARAWTCVVYPESMTPGWVDTLESMGISFVVSPLHDRDHFPDGTLKKPHFHVIFFFAGKQSFWKVLQLTKYMNATRPEAVLSMPGLMRYLCHMDIDPAHNPHDVGKVRYDRNDIRAYNGIDVEAYLELTQDGVSKAISAFEELIRSFDDTPDEAITSYASFKDYLADHHPEMLYLACQHEVSVQMSRYIASRNNECGRERELTLLRKQYDEVVKLNTKQSAQVDALMYSLGKTTHLLEQLLAGTN